MRHYDFPRTFYLIYILYFLCLQCLKVEDDNDVVIKLDVTHKTSAQQKFRGTISNSR